jgi:ribokinase
MPNLLPLVSVLVVNETELAFLTNTALNDDIDQLTRTARSLQATPDQKIVVTIGARGALYVSTDTALHVPSPKVKAVDTTGAGDCFVGALAVALSEQKSMEDGLTFANTAASISVQRLGAAVSVPMRVEVDRIVR